MLYGKKGWSTLRKLMFMKKASGGGESYTEHTVTGNPVSFNTDVEKPLKQLLIPFAPVQAEGTPSPENPLPITGFTGVNVSATGKNLLDPATKTSSSSTVKLWCKANGFLCRGGVVYKVVSSTGNGTVYVKDYETELTIVNGSGKTTYAPTTDTRVYFQYYHGSNAGTAQLMVEVVPSADTFASEYEEYVGTTIPVAFPAVGKNLLNPAEIVKGLYSSADFSMTSTSSNVYRSAKVYLKKGEYTISFGVNINVARLIKDEVYTSSFPATMNNISSYTFTVESDGYFGISWRDTTSSSTVWDDTTPVQIELGSSATSYEPYTNTAYGGTLDLSTGVLTVDTWYIASYNGETIPGEWISDRDVYAPGTFPTIGAEVVYELAEPLEFQLTDINVPVTLIGDNVIFTDTNGQNTVKFLKRG